MTGCGGDSETLQISVAYTGLTDTKNSSYTGEAGKPIVVSPDETGTIIGAFPLPDFTAINAAIAAINAIIGPVPSEIVTLNNEATAEEGAITSIGAQITAINGTLASLAAAITALQLRPAFFYGQAPNPAQGVAGDFFIVTP